ncbi:Uncharacterised protein [Mycolicibacterium vanbaalenii]|uniref:Secreted protein n=1 Tax=Mycolicibacterium vanbaalenii TaxID=110539 RepID=A0A5S9QYF3_MYCVN|nr:hypothetical protein [Mycolicibacterium vanbaalenii]CAA0124557.1 Uncharacterised protein [Mycolicibacterium vanbaalenii]
MKRHACAAIAKTTSVALMLMLSGLLAAAPAQAADCAEPFTGRYTAFSDGKWASKHYLFREEVSVTGTWTVDTDCRDYLFCTGTVVSDQGWTASAMCRSGLWTVTHDVPNWVPCPDGTTATGQQKFTFFSETDPPRFRGWDRTLGPSGACGTNRHLIIEMPFTLTKIE